ncbi:hypothetical protein JB92DRAFT_3203349 [Gautieria morchelliformis]|nr:hypothetical protein JB92DRAFT_3203349 [Gautieria morchelliformis]
MDSMEIMLADPVGGFTMTLAHGVMNIDPTVRPSILEEDTRNLSPTNPCRRVDVRQLCPRKKTGEAFRCGGGKYIRIATNAMPSMSTTEWHLLLESRWCNLKLLELRPLCPRGNKFCQPHILCVKCCHQAAEENPHRKLCPLKKRRLPNAFIASASASSVPSASILPAPSVSSAPSSHLSAQQSIAIPSSSNTAGSHTSRQLANPLPAGCTQHLYGTKL